MSEVRFSVSERNAPFYIQKPRKSATPMKMCGKIRKRALSPAEKAPFRAACVQETADRVADKSGRAVHRRTVPLHFSPQFNRYRPIVCTVRYVNGDREEFHTEHAKLSALLEVFHQCFEVRRVDIRN